MTSHKKNIVIYLNVFFYFYALEFYYLKKTGYILLLAILLLQTGGMLLVYKIQQFYVQYEMSLIVKDSNTSFEKLILSADEYQKSRVNSREILFKGNMYDVKSVKITGNTAELLVINDKKEKKLVKNIKDFLYKTNQQKKELPEQLQKFLSLNYLPADKELTDIVTILSSIIFYSPDGNILFHLSDIPSPPPKLG
jgi:hypothetical protein